MMKFYVIIEVQKTTHVPPEDFWKFEGKGANLPSTPNGKFMHGGHRIYRAATKIIRNMGVRGTNRIAQYVPKTRDSTPLRPGMAQKGGICTSQPLRLSAKAQIIPCSIMLKCKQNTEVFDSFCG
jgi:hypothetical protein